MKGLFIDTETSGLDSSKNLLLEIALCCLDLHNFSCIFSYTSMIYYPHKYFTEKSDPDSLKINGILYQMIESGKKKHDVKHDILENIEKYGINKSNTVIICQNPSFDRAFFSQVVPVEEQQRIKFPYHWLDLASMYWYRFIDHDSDESVNAALTLSKDEIAKRLGLPGENKPHTALGGVYHLIKCYEALRRFD